MEKRRLVRSIKQKKAKCNEIKELTFCILGADVSRIPFQRADSRKQEGRVSNDQ